MKKSIDKLSSNLLFGNYWQLKLLIYVLVVSIILTPPPLHHLFMSFYNNQIHLRWDAIKFQSNNLFENLNYPVGSHESKLTFRLIPAILMLITGKHEYIVYIIQFFLGLFSYLAMFSYLDKVFTNKKYIVYFSLSFIGVYSGSAFLFDFSGYNDAFAYSFLLLAICSRSNILLFIFLILSFFTDERAIFSSFLIFLISFFDFNKTNNVFSFRRITILFSILLYFLIRIILINVYDLQIDVGNIGLQIIKKDFNQIGWGVWSSFDSLWILILYPLYLIFLEKKITLFSSTLLAIFIVIFISISVTDITRSMAYAFPMLFIGLSYFKDDEKLNRFILLFVAVISLISPLYYSLGNSQITWIEPLPIKLLNLLIK